MNDDSPPQFNPLAAPGFPVKQLKRLHRELTAFEMFIAMNASSEDAIETKENIKKIYAVQELIEGFVIEETERLKIIKAQ